MTCEDCIHFTNKKVENMGDTDLVFCDAFDKDSVTRASQWANECKSFENNDGTYSNGTWHCPRCGAIVSNAGLCDECDKAVDSWESVSK